jgi:hypothetical protein
MLDIRTERREAASMSEDDPKALAPLASAEHGLGPKTADPSMLEASRTAAPGALGPEGSLHLEGALGANALGSDGALSLVTAAATVGLEPAAPPAPVNKLHEWAAALAIMVFLTAVMFGFIYFLRGSSL